MGNAVDPTGLSFTVTKKDGTTASVSPQTLTPTTWGDTAGTQTCTFTYSDGYDSVSCEVEATVLAEELSSIAVSGTPVSPIENGLVNATGLTVTATYNSGRTANVTSSVIWTDANTGTDHVGSCIYWNSEASNWHVTVTRVHASYTEGGVTKEANSSSVLIASQYPANTAEDTPYQLAYTANSDMTFDIRGISGITSENLKDPVNGTMTGGYLIEGASKDDFGWMSFTAAQWAAPNTPVTAQEFGAMLITGAFKLAPDTNGPAWSNINAVNGDSWTFSNAVTGAVDDETHLPPITLPYSVVSIFGQFNKPIDPAVGICPADFATGAKTVFVDIVAAS